MQQRRGSCNRTVRCQSWLGTEQQSSHTRTQVRTVTRSCVVGSKLGRDARRGRVCTAANPLGALRSCLSPRSGSVVGAQLSESRTLRSETLSWWSVVSRVGNTRSPVTPAHGSHGPSAALHPAEAHRRLIAAADVGPSTQAVINCQLVDSSHANDRHNHDARLVANKYRLCVCVCVCVGME